MDRKHAYSAPALAAPARNVILYSEGTGQFSPTHSFQTVKDEQTQVESQVLQVLGMPVFRTGSFKDSMGELSTWETLHIDQMVSSFSFLREHSIFPEVPVREGHGSFFGEPMTGLVGYHTGLSARDAVAPDGQTYRYILADFTLNKPEAQQAYLNGLWRNRSAEVGFYEDNKGTSYYPVFQGFAFVDIPAVQFLNLFGKEKQRSFSVLFEKEIPMSAPVTPPVAPTLNPDGSIAPSGGGQLHGAPALPIPPVVTPPALVVPAGEPAAPVTPTAPGNAQFTCNGQQTSDFAAVQSYITKLETDAASFNAFKADQTRIGRVAFVKKLAADKKILASQVGSDEAGKETGLIGLALTLDEAQFTTWSATYESLPVNPLFTTQPSGGGTDPAEGDLSDDEKEYKAAKDRVEWHRSARMPQPDLENTESWKTYKRLHESLKKKGAL